MANINRIIHGDCLEVMKQIQSKSVRLIVCDLPFGMTQNEWDKKLPYEPLWNEYKRIIMDNGAIILFAKGMFTAELMLSNPKMYRYKYTWVKNRATGHLNANKMPMQATEDVLVFYKKLPVYNPQKTQGHEPVPLLQFLVNTYSNSGEMILDNCSGVGSLAEACINTNRLYTCIEKDELFYKKSVERVSLIQAI